MGVGGDTDGKRSTTVPGKTYEYLATGAPILAELCGWVLVEDDETGEDKLMPAGHV